MENLDERAQRIQDRLREAGDDEAAELIDELYGLWHNASEELAAATKVQPKTKRNWAGDGSYANQYSMLRRYLAGEKFPKDGREYIGRLLQHDHIKKYLQDNSISDLPPLNL